MKTEQHTILVVDDEKAIQKILKHYFGDKYKVHTCNNGEEALKWLYSGNLPEAIVADINMPVLNGFEFIKELKTSGLFTHIPVVFLSGVDDSNARIKCFEAGADDFLIKPFNPVELERRLASIIRRVYKQAG